MDVDLPNGSQKQKKYLMIAVGVCFVLFGLIFLAKGIKKDASLAGVVLSTLDGKTTRDMGACSSPKCLTMYVAPWCGICRRSTGVIRALRDHLNAKGVETRVVVGRDKPGEVRAYALEFGGGTFIDSPGNFPLKGGVPNFVVSDAEGKVLKISPGVPGFYEPPYETELLNKLAGWMGAL